MEDSLRREIEAVRQLKTRALKDRYRALFGESSPSSNRMHLFRRIAWRLQARAEGGLSDRARRRARQLANDADLRLRAPRSFWDQLENQPPPPPLGRNRDPRLPPVGTVLRRSYRGQEIAVIVQPDGFEYNGTKYTALSAIACQITGTRWNGFTFFALNSENRRG